MEGILYTHVLPFKWWRSRRALRDHTPETDLMRVDAAAEANPVEHSRDSLVTNVYGRNHRSSDILSRSRG